MYVAQRVKLENFNLGIVIDTTKFYRTQESFGEKERFEIPLKAY